MPPLVTAAATILCSHGGQVQLATDFITTYIPLVQDGKLRALAVTSKTRSIYLPDTPTTAEAPASHA